MNRDRIESNTRQSGGPTHGRRGAPSAGGFESTGRREHLLAALKECYGIATGEAEHQVREFEARSDRASEVEANSVAALLRAPHR
jgi:hypothetical protein